MYIVLLVGFMFVVASMAEMFSLALTAGGNYRWITEFAPRGAQDFLSYMLDWLRILARQCGIVAGSFLAVTELQGVIF